MGGEGAYRSGDDSDSSVYEPNRTEDSDHEGSDVESEDSIVSELEELETVSKKKARRKKDSTARASVQAARLSNSTHQTAVGKRKLESDSYGKGSTETRYCYHCTHKPETI